MFVPLMQSADALDSGNYARPAAAVQHTRRYSLPLPDATPDAAALARRFVEQHAPASIAEAAVYAASELVGNVLRHAPGPASVVLTVRQAMVVISVIDARPEIPVQLPAPGAEWDMEAESMRGLAIIAALGAELLARCDAGHKRVTARFPIGDVNA